jgi:PAS domain-containing protein
MGTQVLTSRPRGLGWEATTAIGGATAAVALAAASTWQLVAPGTALAIVAGGAIATAAAVAWSRRAAASKPDVHAAALALGGDGTWVYDLRANTVTFDDRCAQMLGYDRGHVADRLSAWGKLVHPEDLASARAALDAFITGESDKYEARVRLRDVRGCWRQVLDRGTVVARDAKGKPTRLVGIHRPLDGAAQPDATTVDDAAPSETMPELPRAPVRWLLSELDETITLAQRRADSGREPSESAAAWAQARELLRRVRALDAREPGPATASAVPSVLEATIARRCALHPETEIDARLAVTMRRTSIDAAILGEVFALVIDELSRTEDGPATIVVREADRDSEHLALVLHRNHADDDGLLAHLPRLRAATAWLEAFGGGLSLVDGHVHLQLPTAPTPAAG